MAFIRGRWGGVSVSLFVMMVEEVIEGLNCRGEYGVKGDAVFIGAGEVL